MLYKSSLSKAAKTKFEDAWTFQGTFFQHAHERSNWISQILAQHLINIMMCFGIGNWRVLTVLLYYMSLRETKWVTQGHVKNQLKAVNADIPYHPTATVVLDIAPFQGNLVIWLFIKSTCHWGWIEQFFPFIYFCFPLIHQLDSYYSLSPSFLALAVQPCGASWCWSCWCWRYQISSIFYPCGLGRTDEMNRMQGYLCTFWSSLWQASPAQRQLCLTVTYGAPRHWDKDL